MVNKDEYNKFCRPIIGQLMSKYITEYYFPLRTHLSPYSCIQYVPLSVSELVAMRYVIWLAKPLDAATHRVAKQRYRLLQ